MALNVTLDLPPDVEEKLRRETPNLDADVRERQYFLWGQLYRLTQ